MSGQLDMDSRYMATRQKILDQAYRIVLEQGIQQLSMRSIATAVHSSPANLYEYFTGKDEIIYELQIKLFNDLAKHLKTVDQAVSPTEYLEQLGLAYLHFAQQHTVLLRLHSYDQTTDPWFNTRGMVKLNGTNTNHYYNDRTKPLWDILQHAIHRYYATDSHTPGSFTSEINDRTIAYWSLLHGYATLMGIIARPDLTLSRWQTLVQQFLA